MNFCVTTANMSNIVKHAKTEVCSIFNVCAIETWCNILKVKWSSFRVEVRVSVSQSHHDRLRKGLQS